MISALNRIDNLRQESLKPLNSSENICVKNKYCKLNLFRKSFIIYSETYNW